MPPIIVFSLFVIWFGARRRSFSAISPSWDYLRHCFSFICFRLSATTNTHTHTQSFMGLEQRNCSHPQSHILCWCLSGQIRPTRFAALFPRNSTLRFLIEPIKTRLGYHRGERNITIPTPGIFRGLSFIAVIFPLNVRSSAYNSYDISLSEFIKSVKRQLNW